MSGMRPVPGMPDRAASARPPVWWGTFWGLVVLAIAVATLVSSFLYLRYAADDWPPAAIDPPPVGFAAAATALLVAGMGGVQVAALAGARGRRGPAIGIAVLVALTGAGALGLGVAAALDTGIPTDAHAYGSLLYTDLAVHGVLTLGAVVLVASGAEALRQRGDLMPLRLGALVWTVNAALAVLSFATFYLGLRVL